MKRATALLILATALACFDPLYEDGMTSGFFVCCQGGSVGTCACQPGSSCLPSFKVCAAGRCSSTLSCASGTGGGSSGGGFAAGGGSSAGGGFVTGGGSSAGGSASSDAGVAGGGSASSDAGMAGGGSAGSDAGVSGGGSAGGGSAGGGSAGSDAGVAGGGSAGGGTVVEPEYELCCLSGLVTTCFCASTGCSNAPFTACASNRCVAGTTTGVCR